MQFYRFAVLALVSIAGTYVPNLSADDAEMVRAASSAVKSISNTNASEKLATELDPHPNFSSTSDMDAARAISDVSKQIMKNGTSNEDKALVNDIRSPNVGQSENQAIQNIINRSSAIESAAIQSAAVTKGDSSDEKISQVKEPKMYVMLSLSMPEAQIRSLFAEASHYDPGEVVFEFRGWHPPDITGFYRKVGNLLPLTAKKSAMPTVEIDPSIFRNVNVNQVPTFFVKDGSTYVKAIGGETLANVAERVRNKQNLSFGRTYSIDEPDIISYIEEKAKTIDWNAQIAKAEQGMFNNKGMVELNAAEKSGVVDVDMSLRVGQSIKGPDGKIVAEAGQVVNPLDYISMSKKYAFFNASSERQIEIVENWSRDRGDVVLIATDLPTVESQRVSLERRLKKRVFMLDKTLVERFKLTGLPSLAYQNGRFVRVETVAPRK